MTGKPLAALPWPGGKSAAAPTGTGRWVAGLLPADRDVAYIEPFAGMLGVLLQRPPSKVEIVNDADRSIVNWWLTVRHQPEALARALDATPSSRVLTGLARARGAERDGADDPPPHGDLEWAADWAVMCCCTLGALGDDWARRQSVSSPGLPIRLAGPRIAPLAARLANVQLECGDAVSILEWTAGNERAVIYADPPYRGIDGYYGAGVDHDALDAALLAQRGRVAVSGYPGDRDALEAAGWERHERRCHQTMAGVLASPQDPRTECAWTNYDPPGQGTLL